MATCGGCRQGCGWEATSKLAKALVAAGFRYCPKQDITYSKIDAWQRQTGFTWPYDVASARLHMIIDCETFYFNYAGTAWLIELWKGQYGLKSGAEIGVYYDGVVPANPITDPKSRFYGKCLPLNMNFTLRRKNTIFLTRGPESHWWLTGFKWGEFTRDTLDLTLDLEIECLNPAMRDAFNQAVIKRGYHNSAKGYKSVAFTFTKPKTVQPESRGRLEDKTQTHNQFLVDGYNLYKLVKNISTNDPNEITELEADARKAAVHVISGAAKQVQSHASAAANRFQSKAGHFGKAIQSKTAPVAKKVQGKVVAAVDTIQSVPDEARAAYDEIFRFYDKKVWHVTR
jgi:hypothetical protein